MSELNPITRKEMFLAAAAGQDIELPKPITRKEMFLAKIAEQANSGGGNSGGGTGGSGVTSWNDLEDKPFGAEKVVTTFVYDENNTNNVVLNSGKTLYHVAEFAGYLDRPYASLMMPSNKRVEISLDERETIFGTTDEYMGYTPAVGHYKVVEFSFVDYEEHIFEIFYWDSYERITFEYEGEEIVLPTSGWYAYSNFANSYVENVFVENVEVLDEKFIPESIARVDEIGDMSITWDNIANKPFYSEEEWIPFNYNEDEWRNVTLASGNTLYYVSDVTADSYSGLSVNVYSVYFGQMSYNLNDFREYIAVVDEYGDEYSVYCYKLDDYFTDSEEMCRVVLFSNDNGSITFDFEGETIALSNSGFYALRTSDDYYASSLMSETIETLPAKFLPKAAPVTDATGETVTAEEFNDLLYKLRVAGYLSE